MCDQQPWWEDPAEVRRIVHELQDDTEKNFVAGFFIGGGIAFAGWMIAEAIVTLA